jgi:hypothetical protein
MAFPLQRALQGIPGWQATRPDDSAICKISEIFLSFVSAKFFL